MSKRLIFLLRIIATILTIKLDKIKISFNVDLCSFRHRKSFATLKSGFEPKGNILAIISTESGGPRGPSRSYAYDISSVASEIP